MRKRGKAIYFFIGGHRSTRDPSSLLSSGSRCPIASHQSRQSVLGYLQFWVGLPVTVAPERSGLFIIKWGNSLNLS
jgi:hypothetical protein